MRLAFKDRKRLSLARSKKDLNPWQPVRALAVDQVRHYLPHCPGARPFADIGQPLRQRTKQRVQRPGSRSKQSQYRSQILFHGDSVYSAPATRRPLSRAFLSRHAQSPNPLPLPLRRHPEVIVVLHPEPEIPRRPQRLAQLQRHLRRNPRPATQNPRHRHPRHPDVLRHRPNSMPSI